MWLLSTLNILNFNLINSYICIIQIAIVSIVIIVNDGSKKYTVNQIKKRIKSILISELAFLIIFLIGCYVKSYKPEAIGLEKFMDYGFMNIIDKTEQMPPKDMWISGENINYYYMGQFYAAYINKLAGTSISYGYNLALVTIFATSTIAIFSISYNLIQQINFKKKKNKYSTIGGVLSTIAVNFAGNFHYTIYGLFIPIYNKLTGIKFNQDYYFWNSTRFIGYNPDTNDKTIHEFPMYSYIVGDLHAHVINIIFVVTLLGILVSHLLNNKNKNIKKIKIRNLIDPQIIMIGFLIGIFKMSNYWDFPIYTVVTALVFIFLNLKIYEKKKNAILATVIQTIIVIIIPLIISMPFMLSFNKISSAIKFVSNSTPMWQLMILWGLPSLTIIYYFINVLKEIFIKEKKSKDSTFFKKIISKISDTDLFILILGVSAIGLIIIPEIIYVKDIYEPTQPRANTMFKLTFQSFIMFGICFGYIIVKLLFEKKKLYNNIAGIIISVALLTTTLYPLNSVSYWFGNIFDYTRNMTLDSEDFFKKQYSTRNEKELVPLNDDYEIIKWIRNNTKENDVILEESGDDYEYSNQVSTFTSRPTVIGWCGHEWLWRSVNSSTEIPEMVNERINDVFEFYTSNNYDKIKDIINKYNISYIVVGTNERIKYNNDMDSELACETLLKEIGNVVFETNLNNRNVPTIIIKVK